MDIIEGNINNFDKLISKHDVLVCFHAVWCGPCKMLETELEKVKDIVQIIKIDVDKNRDLCKEYGVMSVPTLLYFDKDGNVIKNVGFINSTEIIKFIKK